MDESILNSVKKLLGYPPEMDAFDADIIVNINVALLALTQLGVGPTEGFIITGSEETFSDFLPDSAKANSVAMYLFAKTKLGFDPPTSGTLVQSYKDLASEYEFRLSLSDSEKED